MRTVHVKASKKYTVQIGSGLLPTIGAEITKLISPSKAAIISDSNVWPLYGSVVTDSLAAAGIQVVHYVIPAGEESKCGAVYLELLNFLAEKHITRTDCLVALGGGVVDPLPEDAPFFVKDYYDYYKTQRGYHPRSLNSNNGWNVIGCMSFLNQPILHYSNEIRSAVLMIHGEKAHSCYFSKDAFANMVKDNSYADNKELLIIPNAVHTDLYDQVDVIPFDKMEKFFKENLCK